jgi:hypothetical protein
MDFFALIVPDGGELPVRIVLSGRAYSELLRSVRDLPLLSGSCYTQFADTYQERNGLLFADRTPKFPIERIAEATTGIDFQRFEAAQRRRKSSRKLAKEMTEAVSGGVSNRG